MTRIWSLETLSMSRCKCAPVFAKQMLTYKMNPVFPTVQGKGKAHRAPAPTQPQQWPPFSKPCVPSFPKCFISKLIHHAIPRWRGQAAVHSLGYAAGEQWSRCRHQPGAEEVEASISALPLLLDSVHWDQLSKQAPLWADWVTIYWKGAIRPEVSGGLLFRAKVWTDKSPGL